jgi:hypothetical protein
VTHVCPSIIGPTRDGLEFKGWIEALILGSASLVHWPEGGSMAVCVLSANFGVASHVFLSLILSGELKVSAH